MKGFAIVLALFSFSAMASTSSLSDGCRGESPEIKLPKIDDLMKPLEWFGASETQIINASCKTKQALPLNELKDFINSKKGVEKKNAKIAGVNFTGESPALINAFRHLTTAMDTLGFGPLPEKQVNIQSKFQINPECTKVQCAVEKIWGEELGNKTLFLLMKYNYNSSEFAYDSSDRMENEEMDDVLMALEDVPARLVPFVPVNHRLSHYSRGFMLKMSPNALANASIMLFDSWSKSTRTVRQYALFHEASHNLSSKFKDQDENPQWLKLSGWIKKGSDWNHDEQACFTSQYGVTNPAEDWAETLTAYRYNGAQLKNSCPKKFEYIKKIVFNGVDFITNAACSTIDPKKVQQVANEVMPAIEASTNAITPEIGLLKSQCVQNFTQYPVTNEQAQNCSSNLYNEKINEMKKSDIEAAMKNAQIPVTLKNVDTLKALVGEKIKQQLPIEKNAPLVSKMANEEMERALQSMPEKFEKNADFKLYHIKNLCRKDLWTNQAAFKECAAKSVYDDHLKWSSFRATEFSMKIPEIFQLEEKDKADLLGKRNEVVLEKLKNGVFLDQYLNPIAVETKTEVKKHLHYKSQLVSSREVKDLEPKEFCQKVYGGTSAYSVQMFAENQTDVPGFAQWCEEMQAGKRKRFFIDKEDIDHWVDQNLFK